MKTFIRFCQFILFITFYSLTIDGVYPQSCGILDLSFGNNGKVITDLGSADYISSIAIQPDGKIIAAGYSLINNDWDFTIVRYNIDGSIDSTFGQNGHVFTDFYSRHDFGLALKLLKNGKILLAGSARDTLNTHYFAIARYNNNGTLDSSFNGNGKVLIYSGGVNDAVNSISVQDDFKIILAGFIHDMDFCIMRLNLNGTLDSTFNGCGIVTTHLTANGNFCYSSEIQNDGKIIAAGRSSDNSVDYFSMVRFNTDGSIDSSFGNNGIVLTTLGQFSCSYDITIQPDSKIILTGVATNKIALVRYKPGCSVLDNSFGNNGIVKTDFFGYTNYAFSTLYQHDQKITVGGYACTPYDCDFVLVRYNPDGSLDDTFGTDGKVTTDFGSGDVGVSLAVQSDSTIILGGYSGNMYQSNFALARYKCQTVGINKIQNDINVDIFPNPTTSLFTLQVPFDKYRVQISNFQGQVIQTFVISGQKKMNFELNNDGIYFIKVTTDKQTVIKKIVVCK